MNRFILISCLFFTLQLNAQPYYRRYRLKLDVRPITAVGVSAGNETFIGMPKFAQYVELYARRGRAKERFGFSPASLAIGAEGSIFGLFAIGGSVGVYSQLNLAYCNVAVGYTASGFMLNEAKFGYQTYNLKFGINPGPVWLRAGISRSPFSQNPMEFGLIDGNYWNFEVLITLPYGEIGRN